MNFEGHIPSSPMREVVGVNTLRPFTIKQILSIEAEELSSTVFRYDGTEVSNIVTAGWIRESKATHVGKAFTLEDGTGLVDCSFWSSSIETDPVAELIEVAAFVRVFGALRLFGGKKSITATHVGKICDGNYLAYHFLNCIHSHLVHTGKISALEDKENCKSDTSVGNISVSDDRRLDEAGLTKIQVDVLRCYRGNQGDKGLSVDIVCGMLRERHLSKDVRAAADFLIENSYLFYLTDSELHTTGD